MPAAVLEQPSVGTARVRRRHVRRARLLVARTRRDGLSGPAQYVAAVGVRTAARGIWGLALPSLLTVTAYGQYNLLATLVAVAVQLAVLGAPQTIVRHAGRALPTATLLAHAIVVALAVLAVATLIAPPGGARTIGIAAAAVCGAATYALLSARAKARFAFGTSLRAEVVAAVALLGGLAVLVLGARTCGAGCLDAEQAVLVEAAAIGGAAIVLLVAARTRLRRADLSTRGSFGVLGSVYSVGFLAALDLVLYRRLDVYFLEQSPDGLAGVAVFGLALQLATMLLIVPTSILEAWQPALAIQFREDRAAFDTALRARRQTFHRCLAATAAVGLLVPLVAVPLAFPKYTPWLGYIAALVLVRVGYAVAGFHSATLYAIGGQRWMYRPVLVGSVVAVVANTALTLRFGLTGVLAAQLITQTTVSVLTARAFHRASRDPALVSATV